MIIDPELRKAIRETLQAKKREYHQFSPWKARRAAAEAFLKANPGIAKRVRYLQREIKALGRQQEKLYREIMAFGLNRQADSIGDEKKFRANGGTLPAEIPPVPSFDSVISKLAAATTTPQCNAILREIGVHWKPLLT